MREILLKPEPFPRELEHVTALHLGVLLGDGLLQLSEDALEILRVLLDDVTATMGEGRGGTASTRSSRPSPCAAPGRLTLCL